MSGTEQLLSVNNQTEHKLFVGDLDEHCNEKILLSNFSKYKTRKAIVQKSRKKPFSAPSTADKYYGILYFEKKEDLHQAQKEMDNQVILNNRIRVCIYKNYNERINSDIFLKGVGNLTTEQMKNYFNQFGEVVNVKIPKDKDGQTLNYSYLSFNDKESRDKCLNQCQEKTVEIGGQSVEVQSFVPYSKRERIQNNIYIKNLPGKNEQYNAEKVENVLKQEAQKYGNVTSMMVKFDEKHQKHFAFVCYSDSEDAKKAYNQIEQFQIDNQKVEVNWAQTKQERTMQNIKKSINKTNIFMKNLLETVDENQLKKAFEKFGVIKSAAVRMPMKVPAHVTQKTQMGFINFQNESIAQEAISSIKNQQDSSNENINSLFLNNTPELCFHKTKQQMSSNSKQNNMNLMQMIHSWMNNPQMFMQAMNQVMMMNMNMMMKGPNRNRNMNMNMMGKPQNMMQGMGMPMMGARYPMMSNNNNMSMPMNMQAMNMPNMMASNMTMANMNMPTMGMANINKPNQNQQVPDQKLTPSSLKENLSEFLKYDQDKQRSILGELLFPAVAKLTANNEQVPKITGMLIDFDVFEVAEILEFLENDELLKERIQEAEELIENTVASN